MVCQNCSLRPITSGHPSIALRSLTGDHKGIVRQLSSKAPLRLSFASLDFGWDLHDVTTVTVHLTGRVVEFIR